jgi:hypothetical protein
MALLLVHTVSDRAKRLSFLKNVWQERYASMIDMTAWDVDKIASVLCPVVPGAALAHHHIVSNMQK